MYYYWTKFIGLYNTITIIFVITHYITLFKEKKRKFTFKMESTSNLRMGTKREEEEKDLKAEKEQQQTTRTTSVERLALKIQNVSCSIDLF